jgi:hypothetical protein
VDELASYVVRVYRKEQGDMTGTVESVESGEQRSFTTNDQLWRAVYDLPSPSSRRYKPSEHSEDQS